MAHRNPRFKDREATAPYNFVPLSSKALSIEDPPGHNAYAANTYSGEFACEVALATPGYIRGPLTEHEFAAGAETKNKPGFFSIDGGKTPRIPGASLRGLFRGLIEIASFSRISNVTNQPLAYRAVDTTSLGIQYRKRIMEEVEKNFFVPRVRGGYVRNIDGKWYIQPAVSFNGATWCRIQITDIPAGAEAWPPRNVQDACQASGAETKNAQTIYVQPGQNEFQEVRGGFLKINFARAIRAAAQPGPGLRTAALATSGNMMSKRSEAVIYEPDNAVDQKAWLPMKYAVDPNDPEGDQIEIDNAYRDQITDSQRFLLGSNGALRDLQPVFYLAEGGRLIFFGHTQMLRVPYTQTPRELIPPGLQTAADDALDLSESLFGYVRPRTNKAHAGRVSFLDGIYANNLPDPFERIITPRVLSRPKLTTFQHYLDQPMPDAKDELRNYDDTDARIRGHKLYWHKGETNLSDVEEVDRDKLKHATQYTRIQMVKRDARFHFALRFENLRLEELGALAWVLRIAGDSQYRLSLGMGKPLGMGAIAITSKLRLSNRPARYACLLDKSGDWETGDQPEGESQVTCQQAINAFEKRATRDSDLNPTKVANFGDLPRIRELLALLSWPGPDRLRTRYMEIEHRDATGRKTNEYRDRPVLPTPTFVMNPKYDGDRAPAPPRQRDDTPPDTRSPLRPNAAPARESLPVAPLPEIREQVSDSAKAFADDLARSDKAHEGEEYSASVLRVTANDYECRLGAGIRTPGKLPRDEAKGLKVGDAIRVKVKRIAGSGAAILTTRGVGR